ncbi:MAG: PspC domain-containing protein [Patescibacteria group bacterium]
MHTKPKRLYKSSTDKVLAGICGGVGEYFDIDPVLIRVIWLLVVIFTGFVPGVLAYIVATFIVPERLITQ